MVGLIVINGGSITKLRLSVPVEPPASVLVTVKLTVPTAVGVPVMAPAVLKLKPAGKLPVLTT